MIGIIGDGDVGLLVQFRKVILWLHADLYSNLCTMKSKPGLWQGLERLSGGAVIAEWALELGDEFERARKFLRSTGVNAASYPCTNRFPCGCRHRLEPLRRGGWVAVCDCGGCEPIRLKDPDVRVFELDVSRLAEAVLRLCGWEVQIRPTDIHGAWQVGILGDNRTPVFWWAGNRQEHLRRVLDELMNMGAQPFALLVPTPAHLSLPTEALLKREGCVAVPIAEFERAIISERVQAGLKAARARGAKLGRPSAHEAKRSEARVLRAQGLSIRTISAQLGINKTTVNQLIRP